MSERSTGQAAQPQGYFEAPQNEAWNDEFRGSVQPLPGVVISSTPFDDSQIFKAPLNSDPVSYSFNNFQNMGQPAHEQANQHAEEFDFFGGGTPTVAATFGAQPQQDTEQAFAEAGWGDFNTAQGTFGSARPDPHEQIIEEPVPQDTHFGEPHEQIDPRMSAAAHHEPAEEENLAGTGQIYKEVEISAQGVELEDAPEEKQPSSRDVEPPSHDVTASAGHGHLGSSQHSKMSNRVTVGNINVSGSSDHFGVKVGNLRGQSAMIPIPVEDLTSSKAFSKKDSSNLAFGNLEVIVRDVSAKLHGDSMTNSLHEGLNENLPVEDIPINTQSQRSAKQVPVEIQINPSGELHESIAFEDPQGYEEAPQQGHEEEPQHVYEEAPQQVHEEAPQQGYEKAPQQVQAAAIRSSLGDSELMRQRMSEANALRQSAAKRDASPDRLASQNLKRLTQEASVGIVNQSIADMTSPQAKLRTSLGDSELRSSLANDPNSLRQSAAAREASPIRLASQNMRQISQHAANIIVNNSQALPVYDDQNLASQGTEKTSQVTSLRSSLVQDANLRQSQAGRSMTPEKLATSNVKRLTQQAMDDLANQSLAQSLKTTPDLNSAHGESPPLTSKNSSGSQRGTFLDLNRANTFDSSEGQGSNLHNGTHEESQFEFMKQNQLIGIDEYSNADQHFGDPHVAQVNSEFRRKQGSVAAEEVKNERKSGSDDVDKAESGAHFLKKEYPKVQIVRESGTFLVPEVAQASQSKKGSLMVSQQPIDPAMLQESLNMGSTRKEIIERPTKVQPEPIHVLVPRILDESSPLNVSMSHHGSTQIIAKMASGANILPAARFDSQANLRSNASIGQEQLANQLRFSQAQAAQESQKHFPSGEVHVSEGHQSAPPQVTEDSAKKSQHQQVDPVVPPHNPSNNSGASHNLAESSQKETAQAQEAEPTITDAYAAKRLRESEVSNPDSIDVKVGEPDINLQNNSTRRTQSRGTAYGSSKMLEQPSVAKQEYEAQAQKTNPQSERRVFLVDEEFFPQDGQDNPAQVKNRASNHQIDPPKFAPSPPARDSTQKRRDSDEIGNFLGPKYIDANQAAESDGSFKEKPEIKRVVSDLSGYDNSPVNRPNPANEWAVLEPNLFKTPISDNLLPKVTSNKKNNSPESQIKQLENQAAQNMMKDKVEANQSQPIKMSLKPPSENEEKILFVGGEQEVIRPPKQQSPGPSRNGSQSKLVQLATRVSKPALVPLQPPSPTYSSNPAPKPTVTFAATSPTSQIRSQKMQGCLFSNYFENKYHNEGEISVYNTSLNESTLTVKPPTPTRAMATPFTSIPQTYMSNSQNLAQATPVQIVREPSPVRRTIITSQANHPTIISEPKIERRASKTPEQKSDNSPRFTNVAMGPITMPMASGGKSILQPISPVTKVVSTKVRGEPESILNISSLSATAAPKYVQAAPNVIKFYEPSKMGKVVEKTELRQSQTFEVQSPTYQQSTVRVISSGANIDSSRSPRRTSKDHLVMAQALPAQPQIKLYQSTFSSQFQNAIIPPPSMTLTSSGAIQQRVVRSPSPGVTVVQSVPSQTTTTTTTYSPQKSVVYTGRTSKITSVQATPVFYTDSQPKYAPTTLTQSGVISTQSPITSQAKVYTVGSNVEVKPPTTVTYTRNSRSPSRIIVQGALPPTGTATYVSPQTITMTSDSKAAQWRNASPFSNNSAQPTYFKPYK